MVFKAFHFVSCVGYSIFKNRLAFFGHNQLTLPFNQHRDKLIFVKVGRPLSLFEGLSQNTHHAKFQILSEESF